MQQFITVHKNMVMPSTSTVEYPLVSRGKHFSRKTEERF